MLLFQAVAAADRVSDVAVVSLPWPRDIDGAWLAPVAGDAPVLALGNHLARGGQGDAVRAALGARPVAVWAVQGVPAGGTNDEVLCAQGVDTDPLDARLGAL